MNRYGVRDIMPANEQEELAIKAKAGDTMARDSLMEANHGLITTIAGRHAKLASWGTDLDDLKQLGWIGAIRAIDSWNPEKGRLGPHMSVIIRQNVIDGIKDTGTMIRRPRNYYSDRMAISKHVAAHGPITIEDASKLIGASLDLTAITMAEELHRKDSIDPLVSCSAPDDTDEIDAAIDAADMINKSKLTAWERSVIASVFGIDGNDQQSVREIARRHKTTKHIVAEQRDSAMRKIRKRLGLPLGPQKVSVRQAMRLTAKSVRSDASNARLHTTVSLA